MKKNIVISIMGIIMVILLITFALMLDNQSDKDNITKPNDTTIEDIISSKKTTISSDSFICILLTQIPDIAELVDIRVTCYTMFLIMSDGSEYVVYTDVEEGKITAIYCWDPITNTIGQEIYRLYKYNITPLKAKGLI